MKLELLTSYCPAFLNRSVFKLGLRVSELFILAAVFLVLEAIFKSSAHKFYSAELPVLLLGASFFLLNQFKEDHYVEKLIRYTLSSHNLRAMLLDPEDKLDARR